MSGPLRLPARAGFHVKDVPAGLVLGVQSVPSGLAGGLLAGLSPLTGLYAYLFGTLFIAGATMICTVLAFAELVGYIAMPSLAGLLIVVGFKSMKVDEALLVLRTGSVQAALMGLTFLLTILIPLQYAVLTGVGLSIIMHVARQSNAVRLVAWDFDPDGGVREHDPPAALPAHRVLVLRPYGSLFFAAAQVFEDALPQVTAESRRCAVVITLRGEQDLGSTFIKVVARYAERLADADSTLMLTGVSERVMRQLRDTGTMEVIGDANVFAATQVLTESTRQAVASATAWVEATPPGGEGPSPT